MRSNSGWVPLVALVVTTTLMAAQSPAKMPVPGAEHKFKATEISSHELLPEM